MTTVSHTSILDKLAHDILDRERINFDAFTMSRLTAINQFNGEFVEVVRQSCLDPQTVSRVDLFELHRSHEHSNDYDLVRERIVDEFRSGREDLDNAVIAVITQIYRLLEARDKFDRDYEGD